jgi:hypothetical protein
MNSKSAAMATTATPLRESVGERIIELLEALLDGQTRLIELLEAKKGSTHHSFSDPRPERLLAAIAAILGDAADVPFTSDEVISASGSSYELAEALRTLHLTTLAISA